MKMNKNVFGKNFSYVENKDFTKAKEAQKNALMKVLKNKNNHPNIPPIENFINFKQSGQIPSFLTSK